MSVHQETIWISVIEWFTEAIFQNGVRKWHLLLQSGKIFSSHKTEWFGWHPPMIEGCDVVRCCLKYVCVHSNNHYLAIMLTELEMCPKKIKSGLLFFFFSNFLSSLLDLDLLLSFIYTTTTVCEHYILTPMLFSWNEVVWYFSSFSCKPIYLYWGLFTSSLIDCSNPHLIQFLNTDSHINCLPPSHACMYDWRQTTDSVWYWARLTAAVRSSAHPRPVVTCR